MAIVHRSGAKLAEGFGTLGVGRVLTDSDGAGTAIWQATGSPGEAYTYGHKAQFKLEGGGTQTLSPGVSSASRFKWSDRFITISAGSGAAAAWSGYFDIMMPAVGTVITGVGGAGNDTVTADGILLGGWQALYYILPMGAGYTSNAANFRIVSYTSTLVIPENWMLLAHRISDTADHVRLTNGVHLKNGESFVAGEAMKRGGTIYPTGIIMTTGAASGRVLTSDASGSASWIAPASAPALVSTLPASPVDGQEIHYLADATNGVIWHLRYRVAATGSYKWEFVGGPPLTAGLGNHNLPGFLDFAAGNIFPASGANGNNPTITIPLAGDYILRHQSGYIGREAGAGTVNVKLGINGSQVGAEKYCGSASQVGGTVEDRVNNIAVSATFRGGWYKSGPTGTGNRIDCQVTSLHATPIRVG